MAEPASYGAVPSKEDEADKSRAFEMPIDDAKPTCRDPLFALLFVAHFAFMIVLGVKYGTLGIEDELQNDDDEFETTVGNYAQGVLLYIALPCAVIAFILANIMSAIVLPAVAGIAVKICLLGSLGITLAGGISLCVRYPHWYNYIIAVVAFAAAACYVKAVWRMIPFATVNLKVALKGMTDNWEMYLIALLFSFLIFFWAIFWFYVENGVWEHRNEHGKDAGCSDENLSDRQKEELDCERDFNDMKGYWGIMFFLLVSLFWTIAVILYTIQVTVAGIIATWCFDKHDSDGCCAPAVTSSLFRAVFYSFGSICMGSLLQAIISALRVLAEYAKREADSDGNKCDLDSIIMCLVTCCLRCCEDIVEYFNQWAYVYIGIYGFSYIESGRKVMELFQARGWTAFITNDLVGYVLIFTSIFVAILTGLIGIAFDNEKVGIEGHWDAFGIGFIVGFLVAHVMMSTIKGAVNTVIVCFADAPVKLEEQHPALTKEMAEAWVSVFPDCGVKVPTGTYDVVV